MLSGTPLENRLDDLYSVVEFIDDRRLGPAFRFFNRHRVTDEKGKVLGYKDLDLLRENLKPVLLRRTRSSVMEDLPPGATEIVRVPPTAEQLDIEIAQMRIASSVLGKRYISEMDLLRLQKALLLARMNANSTFLVDKREPGYSSKLERLAELFEELAAEEERKIVLFPEWTTMLGLIERQIEQLDLDYVRLDGSVPQKKRQQLVHRFQRDSACRLFIATNAGSTGLNLQAANTVINVDLPWNPAVLEQRIARAHRMGQKNPVQIYILVTEDTIEEKLLTTLSATSLSRAHDRPHSGRRCVGSRRDGELAYLPVLPRDELGGVLSSVSSCSWPMLVAARSARHTWGTPAVSPRRRRTSHSSPSFTRALTSSVSTPSFDSTTPHTSRRSISA